MEEQSYVNLQEAAVHSRSKREVYELLSMKGGYYFPPMEQTDREYIYDITTGSKKIRFLAITY